jgi:hypothetical protein
VCMLLVLLLLSGGSHGELVECGHGLG